MKIQVFTFLLLFSLTGCANYSEIPSMITSTPLSSITIPETPVATLTPLPRPPYDFIVLNSPPPEIGLPELIVADDGTLDLTSEKGTSAEYSRGILNTNSGCFVRKVTASYSPDFEYIAIAKRCIGDEDYESVYLIHSDGTGLMRTVVGYDSYESGTNRPIEWAPDSKSLIYFRSPGHSDAHIEVFSGIIRYDIETAERKYLAPMWGQYKWSSDGKWIAVLDETNRRGDCQTLYLLDAHGESLYELDKVCEHSNANTEILWQKVEGSNDVLVITQKERKNQNIISREEYEIANLSSYRQVLIK
jgi:hypothetical protein